MLVLLLVVAALGVYPMAAWAACPNPIGSGVRRFIANGATGSGTVIGDPMNAQAAIAAAQPGDVLQLADGHYLGAANMIAFPNGKAGTPTAKITVCAQNDGGVWIDGEDARRPFHTPANSYIVFQGIDFSASSDTVIETGSLGFNSHHLEMYRICAWDARHTPGSNAHVMQVWNTSDSIFEDFCLFGYGRNTFLSYAEGGTTTRNRYSRFWLSWQGYPPSPIGNDAPGPSYQPGYFSIGAEVFEDFITVYNPQLQDQFSQWTTGALYGAGTPSCHSNAPSVSHYRGFISYGYDGPVGGGTLYKDNPETKTNNRWFSHVCANVTISDMFIDGLSQPHNAPFNYSCTAVGANCSRVTLDRLTAIKGSSPVLDTNFDGVSPTNYRECSTVGACPNIYTGTGGAGPGSRACFEYANGTLTSTKKWPWRMDDRVKQALARAGRRTLAGSAGSGYAANTVTSEIVSRYGAIPAGCITSAAPITFPEAVGFPSKPILDNFAGTGALSGQWSAFGPGNGMTRSNGVAVSVDGNFTFARHASVFGQTQEVYATLATLQAEGTQQPLVGFLVQDANNRYIVGVNRAVGASNDELIVAIVIGGIYNELLRVNLGADLVAGDKIGAKTQNQGGPAPQLTTLYWFQASQNKWWQVGQASGPASNSGTLLMGAEGTGALDDFGGGGVAAVLTVLPTTMSFVANVGGLNPSPQPLAISDTNSTGTMGWTAASDVTWLAVSPSSGSDNSVLNISVNIAPGGTPLAASVYTGHITVTAPGATGSPAVTTVTLTLLPVSTPSHGRGGGGRGRWR
jgi:hypothetical protein